MSKSREARPWILCGRARLRFYSDCHFRSIAWVRVHWEDMFRRAAVVALLLAGSVCAQERPLLGRVSVGVVIGANLTDDVPTRSPLILDPIGGASFRLYPYNPVRLVVGPTVEVHLPRRLSVEVDALRRPMSPRYSYGLGVFGGLGLQGTPGFGLTSGGTVPVSVLGLGFATLHPESHTWEFPVLLKQRFKWRRLRPFAGVGPSFRKTNSYANSSHVGIAAGGGIEFSLWRMRLAPRVRYTHWKSAVRSTSCARIRPRRSRA